MNESIIGGLEKLGAAADDVQVVWQTGKFYDQQCKEALAKSGVKNVIQMPFISNMDPRLPPMMRMVAFSGSMPMALRASS